MKWIIIGVVLLLFVVITRSARAQLVEAGPDRLSDTKSLGQIIAESRDQPVHILFVHGIRVGDRGSSDAFRSALCRKASLSCPNGQSPAPPETHRLDLGPTPTISYMGQQIWGETTSEAWEKFGPFVDRYQYLRGDGGQGRVIIDEVNWWPLVLPLRCKALLVPEAKLAGADKDDLRLCAAIDKNGAPLNDQIHYPWLDRATFDLAMKPKPKGAGAAWANGFVKRALMDWGLSDAVIALGPMKPYLHEVVEKAFKYAAENNNSATQPSKFVVVAESLGSFIVFDAYANDRQHVSNVLNDTAYIYFFANQLALLELGRLDIKAPKVAAGATPMLSSSAGMRAAESSAAMSNISSALKRWASAPMGRTSTPDGPPVFKQIIAFSDPSDALTFKVERIDGVKVVNVYDRNGVDLWIGADPVAAHTGHSTNSAVLDQMLRPIHPGPP